MALARVPVAHGRPPVGPPGIIMADEPTGSLDRESGVEIVAMFQRLNREHRITIVFVTHGACGEVTPGVPS
jgi:ABC-type lipoprotein export system ATPase subunit